MTDEDLLSRILFRDGSILVTLSFAVVVATIVAQGRPIAFRVAMIFV